MNQTLLEVFNVHGMEPFDVSLHKRSKFLYCGSHSIPFNEAMLEWLISRNLTVRSIAVHIDIEKDLIGSYENGIDDGRMKSVTLVGGVVRNWTGYLSYANKKEITLRLKRFFNGAVLTEMRIIDTDDVFTHVAALFVANLSKSNQIRSIRLR